MEITDSTLDICLNYIQSGKCILFLGPQFAMNENGEKVHNIIRKELQSSSFKDRLEFSYNNLFIFKNAKPSAIEKMQLNIAFKKAYGKIIPHPIFHSLAAIPFKAIITASPDGYLLQAYREQNIDVNYQYYSRKGNNQSNDEVDPSVSMIYSIFGDLKDEDSLINNYKDFYEFLIALLGERNKLPLELKNRLADTRIFIFLGFDFSRWYFPLLVQKLISFKEEVGDLTAFRTKDNKPGDENNLYFPIEVQVTEQETIPMIEALYKKLKDLGRLYKPGKHDETSKKEKLKALVSKGNLAHAFKELKGYCANSGKSKDDVILVEVRHVELLNQQNLGTISEVSKKLELAQITQATLGLINDFFKE